MAKGKFPEVRAVVEFDRLAKDHLTDAYVHLVPTPKRLLHARIKNQSVLEKEIQQRRHV
jgi:predicted kinase